MKKQNLVLIGFRGAGKTFFGKALAKANNLPFVNLDDEVAFHIGQDIDSFVEKNGWQIFREIEQRVTHDFARNFSGIIATGHSTIENSKNLQNLKKTGSFLFLNPSYFDIRKKLIKEDSFPRLNTSISAAQEIDQMWEQRKNIYPAIANHEIYPDINADQTQEAEKICTQIPKNLIPTPPKLKRIAAFSSEDDGILQDLLALKAKGRIPNIEFSVFLTDQRNPKVLKKCEKAGFKNIEVLEQEETSNEEYERIMINILRENNPDVILIFNWKKKLGSVFCNQFGEITIDTHPSLLPKFADIEEEEIYEKILDYEEKWAGCTLMKMNNNRENFGIVLQRKILVDPKETLQSLKDKIKKQKVLGFCEFLEKVKK